MAYYDTWVETTTEDVPEPVTDTCPNCIGDYTEDEMTGGMCNECWDELVNNGKE